jgi:hypothetical protein
MLDDVGPRSLHARAERDHHNRDDRQHRERNGSDQRHTPDHGWQYAVPVFRRG